MATIDQCTCHRDMRRTQPGRAPGLRAWHERPRQRPCRPRAGAESHLRAVLALHLLQRRESRRQQLQHDGGVDVRDNACARPRARWAAAPRSPGGGRSSRPCRSPLHGAQVLMTRAETRSGPARYHSPSAHTGPQRAQRGHAAKGKPLRRSHLGGRGSCRPSTPAAARAGARRARTRRRARWTRPTARRCSPAARPPAPRPPCEAAAALQALCSVGACAAVTDAHSFCRCLTSCLGHGAECRRPAAARLHAVGKARHVHAGQPHVDADAREDDQHLARRQTVSAPPARRERTGACL